MPQPRACHLLRVDSNARDGLWSDDAAEGQLAHEHQTHRSAVRAPQVIVAPPDSLLIQVVADLREQPHTSAIQILESAKRMTFQENFLYGNIFCDLDKCMYCFDFP